MVSCISCGIGSIPNFLSRSKIVYRSSCPSIRIICLFSSIVYPFARYSFSIFVSRFVLFLLVWLVKYIIRSDEYIG